MNENEYIESYFAGALSTEEIRLFDERIQHDPAFAEAVAFYYSAMQAIKSQVEDEKKERFRELYKQGNKNTETRPLRRLWSYAAAAAIIAGIIFGLFVFTNPSPSKLADQYIQDNFQAMHVKMIGTEDSMQRGVRLFNDGKLVEALHQFESIAKSDSSNFTATKNAGIVSLRLKQYDKALGYFQKMAASPGYNSNPGLFYKAITLLKRDAAGDKPYARQLLQQVVAQGLEGKDDAQRFLR